MTNMFDQCPGGYEEEECPVTPDEIVEGMMSGWFSPMSEGDHDTFDGIKGTGYSGSINGYPVFLDHQELWGVQVHIPVEDGTWTGSLSLPGTFEKDILHSLRVHAIIEPL